MIVIKSINDKSKIQMRIFVKWNTQLSKTQKQKGRF